MQIQFPRALRHGDLIAVVAPSSGVRAPMHGRLDAAIRLLEEQGYRVREGASLRRQHKGASASAEERAAEFMDVLLDPDVAAVIPPWGGERALELQPLIDFDRLAEAPAKWFSGFSDLSTLQVPLLLRSGWASLHGPNLMQLADADLDPVTRRIVDAWHCGRGDTLRQVPSDAGRWRCMAAAGAPMQIEGRLVGGCLDSISRLAGSPHGDVPAFGKATRDEGLLVFLENAELKPFELARALRGLRHAGWFDHATGILIGRDPTNDDADPDAFGRSDAIEAALGGLCCPVILDMDIGHVPPQWSLVQGARALLDWHGDSATLTQMLL